MCIDVGENKTCDYDCELPWMDADQQINAYLANTADDDVFITLQYEDSSTELISCTVTP